MKIFSNCTKKVLIPAAIVLIASAGAGSTAAYFRHAQTIKNVLSVGESTIEITEDYAPPKEMQQGENIYKKKVTVKNTGTVPCYVRVYAGFSDSAVEDVSQLYNPNGWFDAASYQDNLPDGWAFVTPTDDAVVGDGGYYYYTEPLQPGKSTEPLFEKVKTTFAKAIYRQYTMEICMEGIPRTKIRSLQPCRIYENAKEDRDGYNKIGGICVCWNSGQNSGDFLHGCCP